MGKGLPGYITLRDSCRYIRLALRARTVQAHPWWAIEVHVDYPRMKHKIELAVCEVPVVRGICAQIRSDRCCKRPTDVACTDAYDQQQNTRRAQPRQHSQVLVEVVVDDGQARVGKTDIEVAGVDDVHSVHLTILH